MAHGKADYKQILIHLNKNSKKWQLYIIPPNRHPLHAGLFTTQEEATDFGGKALALAQAIGFDRRLFKSRLAALRKEHENASHGNSKPDQS